MAKNGQQTIPGTEPKIPPAILRQARKVIELRNDMELAKQRHDLALDYLHSAMAKIPLMRFVLDEADMPVPLVFKIDQAEPKVKVEHYKKPVLEESSSAT